MARARNGGGGVIGGLLAAVLLAACTALPVSAPPTPSPTPLPETEATVTPTSQALPAGLPPEIASVIAGDLAQRLGVAASDVAFVSVEPVRAPAGDLGCGEATAEGQEPIAAMEIAARAQGETYLYRTDRNKLIPCSANFPGTRAPIYLSGAPTTPAGGPAAAAVADLSQRLSAPAGDIRVVLVEAVDWPDASLGCPQPGMMYAQVITPGYRVVLEAGGKTYNYHGGRGNVFLCTRGKR